jgi:hypothetical protein
MKSLKQIIDDPKRGIRRSQFLVDGHRYEAILDVGGEWDGLAHISDLEAFEVFHGPDGENIPLTIISGARWNGRSLVVELKNIYQDNWRKLIEPATEAFRKMTGN